MMARLLYWLTGFLPCRIINDGTTPYLERYYLGTLFGWRFYLHQFVGSDPDRGLHDHPWRKAFSLILSGWYFEQTRMGLREVNWFNSLTGDTFHRVVLGVNPCWTLFMHTAENVKPWGFWRDRNAPEIINGEAVFEPYQYTREGNQRDWWLTAPTGRAMREGGAA